MRTTYCSKECQVRHWKGPGGHKHGCGLSEEDRLIQKAKVMRDELTRLNDAQDSDAILAMAHEALIANRAVGEPGDEHGNFQLHGWCLSKEIVVYSGN